MNKKDAAKTRTYYGKERQQCPKAMEWLPDAPSCRELREAAEAQPARSTRTKAGWALYVRLEHAATPTQTPLDW
jgi:hypothetical protein